MIDNELTIPLERMGLLDLYNGLNVIQTWDYIKINCSTYLDKISIKHCSTWMKNFDVPTGRPTSLPGQELFIKTFLSATGNPSHALQDKLSILQRYGGSAAAGVAEVAAGATARRQQWQHGSSAAAAGSTMAAAAASALRRQPAWQ